MVLIVVTTGVTRALRFSLLRRFEKRCSPLHAEDSSATKRTPGRLRSLGSTGPSDSVSGLLGPSDPLDEKGLSRSVNVVNPGPGPRPRYLTFPLRHFV